MAREFKKVTGTKLTKAMIADLQARGNTLSVPNCYLYIWESDIFNVTKSDYAIEYEIKVSRSDFFADFNKVDKHKRLEEQYLAKGFKTRTPNKFYYVVPDGLIDEEEVPEYAGLIVYTKYMSFKNIRNAPFLHKEKMNPNLWKDIAMKFYYKTL